jgi:hypothetical protein
VVRTTAAAQSEYASWYLQLNTNPYPGGKRDAVYTGTTNWRGTTFFVDDDYMFKTYVTPQLTPEEQIDELCMVVVELNLANGISNSLDAKLGNALEALGDANGNNDVAACNSLDAFINSVEAQAGNKISVEDADMLILAAMLIQADICGN